MAPSAFGVAAMGLIVAVMARPNEFIERGLAQDRPFELPGHLSERMITIDGDPKLSLAKDDSHRLPGYWVIPHDRIGAADLLVYRTDDLAPDTERLPTDALLIGPIAPDRPTLLEFDEPFVIPCGLVIYSLGEQRIVRTIELDDLFQEDR